MSDYPQGLTSVGHTEPVPRRIRARVAGEIVLDTTRAVYHWDIPHYPQYYIPIDDFDARFLGESPATKDSTASWKRDLVVGDDTRADAVTLHTSLIPDRPIVYARVAWSSVDAWFEEDEEVFTHPRDPYRRVDALRSHREITVSLDGVVIAKSSSPVLLFETGLPTRYYLDPTDVDWTHLVPSETRTSCAYKGSTTGYWSIVTDSGIHPDLAWSYNFPTAAVRPIEGLIAFYNEKVDITIDGKALERPTTQFS